MTQFILICQYILWSTDPGRGFSALSEEKNKNNQCTRSSSVPRLDSIMVFFAKGATPGAWYKEWHIPCSDSVQNCLSYSG